MTSAERIMASKSALGAMELGREVAHFEEATWERSRCDIVYTGNLAKFSQNSILASILRQTEGSRLAFASPSDLVWGTGLSLLEHKRGSPETWPGLNLLGDILMQVRQKI